MKDITTVLQERRVETFHMGAYKADEFQNSISSHDREQVLYTHLGLWEHQRSRRKTYRKIWCQGTETPEKTESYPGRNCKAKSMEKGKGCSQADQVEFRNRRLLVHADVQERLTATLETDAERYVKIHSKASGQRFFR